MENLIPYTPTLATILILLAFSAFFSSAEAAYFSLGQTDRRALGSGGRLARLAAKLSENTEQLLNSILLGNLIVNLLTFTISTIVAFHLQASGRTNLAGLMAVGSLFAVILFGEILPKNLGVLFPQFLVRAWALPLSVVVRFLRPILPMLGMVNILSRRLFWPEFVPEPYLRVGDLERAVEMSREDATLLKREQRVLQNIVSLSDIQAEELMRPRSLIKSFRPPISFDQIMDLLQGKLPRSGYCLLTESDSDEIASVLSFTKLSARDMESWDDQFEPIVYVPWSASVAEVFDRLRQQDRDVAVVVNEFGETVGILTIEDIIETIFTREQGRSRRLLDRMELKKISSDLWLVNGLTSLRRLQRKFGFSSPSSSSLTVGGLLRETLQRFPRTGDCCRFGKFEFQVVDASEDNELTIQLTITQVEERRPHSATTGRGS